MRYWNTGTKIFDHDKVIGIVSNLNDILQLRNRVCINGNPGEPLCFGPPEQTEECDAGK